MTAALFSKTQWTQQLGKGASCPHSVPKAKHHNNICSSSKNVGSAWKAMPSYSGAAAPVTTVVKLWHGANLYVTLSPDLHSWDKKEFWQSGKFSLLSHWRASKEEGFPHKKSQTCRTGSLPTRVWGILSACWAEERGTLGKERGLSRIGTSQQTNISHCRHGRRGGMRESKDLAGPKVFSS